MRFPLVACFALSALCAFAAAGVEEGSINGAAYRIDMPENWNGSLLLFCHGYADNPTTPKLDPMTKVMLDKGFAVAQSGYAAGGWAVEEAVIDTESLRRHFIKKYGKPKKTIVAGGSMGGHLTVTLLEQHPDAYDAGLSLCGAVGPAHWFMTRRIFDLRVVFDHYFPGVYESLDKKPESVKRDRESTNRLLAAINAKPEAADAVKKYGALKSNLELAGVIDFYSRILAELHLRACGLAFDNRNTIYEGTANDAALNDAVRRYTASPAARTYMLEHSTHTGRLQRPLLALQTTYDPLIPGWVTNHYASLVDLAGASPLFVQRYVKRDGHCPFQPAEVEKAFTLLLDWQAGGARPLGGAH
jgi:pimeloyl-ACP methyl ester carboxylesterase